ncbi:unnamed protein product [Sphagnum balticum]
MNVCMSPPLRVYTGIMTGHSNADAEINSNNNKQSNSDVQHIIITGTDMKATREAARLAATQPQYFSFTAAIRSRLRASSLEHLQHCNFDRNEPCSLPVTVDMIAAYMNVQPDEVCRQTMRNTKAVFALDL